MITISQRMTTLVKTIIYYTKKSKRQFTPRLFKNPLLTQRGIQKKQPKQYNYDLPQNLPNRHLYWDRKVQNKISRQRYNKEKLQKLQINPIHDQSGQRVYNRGVNQLIAELTSMKVIKGSVGRTLANIHQAIEKHPEKFLNNGPDVDILKYAIKQLHDRHIATMNFSQFYVYCYLRNRAQLDPTQSLMLHFFRHIQAFKHNKSQKLSIEKLGHLSKYIFSIGYPESANIFYKKPMSFNLFGEGQYKYTTFEDVVPELFAPQYLKQIKQKINDPLISNHMKSIQKMPGGSSLIKKINAAV